MKRNLGRWLYLFLLSPLLLFSATDYAYNLHLNKRSTYLNEPILLTFKVWQTDPKKIIFFEFEPVAHPFDWKMRLLQERRDMEGGAITFEYLLFPQKVGDLSLSFNFIVKRTDEERLRHNNTGEPVKAKAIDTTDTREALPLLHLYVKPLPKEVALVGDYRLNVSVDKHEIEANAPIYLTILLEGVGALPKDLNMTPKIEGVKVFDDEPKIDLRYETDGLHYRGIFSYALLSDHDFTIPAITMEGFSYKQERTYRLQSQLIPIKVKGITIEKLVDLTNTESIYDQLEAMKQWLIYLFVFASGYISALIVQRIRRVRFFKKEEDNSFQQAVKSADSAKALLKVLLKDHPNHYAIWIDQLEKAVYRGEKVDLKKIKKEILKG